MMFNKLCVNSVPNAKNGLICSTLKRLYSDEIRTIKNVDTAFLKRGTGGRSSFSGNVVTVFGATGFLGRYICNQLGKRGCQLIIPHRRDPDDVEVKCLKLAGDLGQVLFQEFDLRDSASIRNAVKYSNVVINLIGRDFETSNFTFNQVHVNGAKEIALACKDCNVERLIHFSALNVTENPKKYYVKKLDFLPSKLRGEEVVLDLFPTATIFRPSAMFGSFDTFLWPLCTHYRVSGTSIPLYAKGEKTIKQPVYVSDVAQGVLAAINDYDSRGKIYQAVGPERYYLKDIAIFCGQTLQRHLDSKHLVHDIKYDLNFFGKVIWYRHILEHFIHLPSRKLAFEYVEKESVTDEVDICLPTLIDLGVPLTKLEDIATALVFDHFKMYPGMARGVEDYLSIESLSAKALNEFSPN